jgi:DNA-binding response OmpR family regulator
MGHRILLFCNTEDGESIASGLGQSGHATTLCSNPNEALALVRSTLPTVLVYRANFQDPAITEGIASMALHPVMGGMPIIALADPLPVGRALSLIQSGVCDILPMPQGAPAIARQIEQTLGVQPGDPRTTFALDQRSPAVIQRVMRYLKSVGGSTAITVDTGEESAHIAFFSGEIVDASFRDLQDDDAIRALLTLDNARIWQIQLETLDEDISDDFDDILAVNAEVPTDLPVEALISFEDTEPTSQPNMGMGEHLPPGLQAGQAGHVNPELNGPTIVPVPSPEPGSAAGQWPQSPVATALPAQPPVAQEGPPTGGRVRASFGSPASGVGGYGDFPVTAPAGNLEPPPQVTPVSLANPPQPNVMQEAPATLSPAVRASYQPPGASAGAYGGSPPAEPSAKPPATLATPFPSGMLPQTEPPTAAQNPDPAATMAMPVPEALLVQSESQGPAEAADTAATMAVAVPEALLSQTYPPTPSQSQDAAATMAVAVPDDLLSQAMPVDGAAPVHPGPPAQTDVSEAYGQEPSLAHGNVSKEASVQVAPEMANQAALHAQEPAAEELPALYTLDDENAEPSLVTNVNHDAAISIDFSFDEQQAPGENEAQPVHPQTAQQDPVSLPPEALSAVDPIPVEIATFDELSVDSWELPTALPTGADLNPLPDPSQEDLNGLADPVALLVDDDPSLLKLYSTLFSKRSWQVHTATDGEAGLYAALEYRPDVIVSDIMMPNLDGWGFLGAMRADFRISESKFILLSCHGEYLSKLNEASAGADAYLEKGTRGTIILKRVQGLIQSRRNLAAVLKPGISFKTDLLSLGVQFLLGTLGAAGVSGTLKVTNRFGEYRVEHDRGIITNATVEAGGVTIKDEEALLNLICVEDGLCEFYLERLMEPPRIGKPFQAMKKDLTDTLNKNRNVSEDKLVSENVRLICKNKTLRDFYVLACPDLVRNLAMELCNGVPPMSLLLKGDVSPVIIESVVKDLLRKGVAAFDG